MARIVVLFLLFRTATFAAAATATTKPAFRPELPKQTVTLSGEAFLRVPQEVVDASKKDGAAPFVVAKAPPTVDVAFHDDGTLPTGQKRVWWSNWGDICVASDGRVYCGIGDHGDDAGGDSYAFLYRYDPSTRKLERLLDVNTLTERKHGEPTFSKIHARIDEGQDRRIYFTPTINDGGIADDPKFKWSETLPGGRLYAYDPKTGKTEVVTNLPPKFVTCSSLMDRAHNVWWCDLDRRNKDALWAFDLTSGKEIFRGPEGSVSMNRNFALARDGSIYFNGPDAVIWRYDPATRSIAATKSKFPDKGMRCSTPQLKDGSIWGVTMGQFQLFRYAPPPDDKLELFGPCFLTGNYTTVCALSPDERFVYFIPGSAGTPLIQLDVTTRQRKVVAFLADHCREKLGFIPAHPFGTKLSADGSTVYMNCHGTAIDPSQPQQPEPKGVSATALLAIHVPAPER